MTDANPFVAALRRYQQPGTGALAFVREVLGAKPDPWQAYVHWRGEWQTHASAHCQSAAAALRSAIYAVCASDDGQEVLLEGSAAKTAEIRLTSGSTEWDDDIAELIG